MKIQDVRFEVIFFSKEVNRPLSEMLSDIGHNFLSKIRDQFEIENTHSLLFYFGNIDDKEYTPKEYYYLGNREIGHIGQTGSYFSERNFLSLNDQDKRLFLLDIFYKSIKQYAIHFNKDITLLNGACQKVLNDGFFRNQTGFIYTRNKLYKCWIEKLLNYKNADYRLCFEDNTTKIREYYFMTNKESVIIKPNSDLKVLLTTPQFFHAEGWNKKEFRVRWGEYGNELYIFDMENKKLRIKMDEAELPEFLK
jgi:hypothetical protein